MLPPSKPEDRKVSGLRRFLCLGFRHLGARVCRGARSPGHGDFADNAVGDCHLGVEGSGRIRRLVVGYVAEGRHPNRVPFLEARLPGDQAGRDSAAIDDGTVWESSRREPDYRPGDSAKRHAADVLATMSELYDSNSALKRLDPASTARRPPDTSRVGRLRRHFSVGNRPLREGDDRSLAAHARAATSRLPSESGAGIARPAGPRPDVCSRGDGAARSTPSPETESPSRRPAALRRPERARLRLRCAWRGHGDQRHRLSRRTRPRRNVGRSRARATGDQRRSWGAGGRHDIGSPQARRARR
jgi:hypothetical protein